MDIKKPKSLRELIEQGYAFPALFPEKNDFLLSELGRQYRESIKSGKVQQKTRDLLNLDRLNSLQGYTVPVIAHDYGAKTPLMWNTLYERLGIPIRSIMLVADPSNIETITDAFRADPKYLGGGFGVGFKEKGIVYLDETRPGDLLSVNIVVKENDRLVGYNTDARGFIKGLEDRFKQIDRTMERETVIVLGAGGVAKEVCRLLAQKKSRIIVLNRTEQKAVKLAEDLAKQYNIVAIGGGENLIKTYALDETRPPVSIINLTDKGSDGVLEDYSAFSSTGDMNEREARELSRELRKANPEIVIADIVLPKSGKSRTLRIAEEEGLRNLVDGIPMVVNQAAPSYVMIQNAHPLAHIKKVDENEALAVFREAAGFKI